MDTSSNNPQLPAPVYKVPDLNPADPANFPVWSSLASDTPERRLKLLELIEGTSEPGSNYLNAIVSYSDYLTHPVDLTDDETGEVFTAWRTIIMGPDHPPIAFVSVGILKSLQRLASVLKLNPPYDPPLQVRISQQATSGGRRTFKLVPVSAGS